MQGIDMKSVDHKEAVRLTWKSRHIPIGTIVLGILMSLGVVSAILSIMAASPSNPIP
ncbi:MAG TPA: hypothetical protein VH743_18820 [Beijerinckiaceae bacterium]